MGLGLVESSGVHSSRCTDRKAGQTPEGLGEREPHQPRGIYVELPTVQALGRGADDL